MTAVELGTEWVKVVQVERRGRSSAFTRASARKIEEGDGTGSGLARALKVLNLASSEVIACVPRQAVTVRTFELPSANPREVGDMIDLQIAKQTPYSRDEIVFDYRLSEGGREGYTRVMLVIAPLAMMRQRFRALEDLGLDVRLMTVSTDGLAAAEFGGSDDIGVLDIDAASAEFAVLQGGAVLFSRSLPVGARDIANDAVTGSERLIQEASRAVETFRHESPAAHMSRLLLAGAVDAQVGLVDRLRAVLGVPVEVLDPLKGGGRLGPAGSETGRPRDVSLTSLAGVALAPERLDIDLTPESILNRKSVERRASSMTLAAVLFMAVLVLLSLWVESRLFAREYYLARLTTLVKSTSAKADEVESMRRKVGLVTARTRGALVPAAILCEIHALLGNDTSLTALELADGHLKLRGISSGGPEASTRLVAALEKSAPLLREAKRERTQTIKDRTEFEIVCDMGTKRP